MFGICKWSLGRLFKLDINITPKLYTKKLSSSYYFYYGFSTNSSETYGSATYKINNTIYDSNIFTSTLGYNNLYIYDYNSTNTTPTLEDLGNINFRCIIPISSWYSINNYITNNINGEIKYTNNDINITAWFRYTEAIANYLYYNDQCLNNKTIYDNLKSSLYNLQNIKVSIDFYNYAKNQLNRLLTVNSSVLCDWYYTTSPIYEFDSDTYSVLSVNRDMIVNSHNYGYSAAFYPQYLYGEIESIVSSDSGYTVTLSHINEESDIYNNWGLYLGGTATSHELGYYAMNPSYTYNDGIITFSCYCESLGTNYGESSNSSGPGGVINQE